MTPTLSDHLTDEDRAALASLTRDAVDNDKT